MSEATWYLRTQDETFGPETREKLIEWARLGRVQPGQEISDDQIQWTRVEEVPFLDMRFSIDLGDGNPRGPFHRAAAEALLASGRLPLGAQLVEVRAPFEAEPLPEQTSAPTSEVEVQPIETPVESPVESPAETPSEAVSEAAPVTPPEPPRERIVEKVVEKIVEKVVVDETRVKELEATLRAKDVDRAALAGRLAACEGDLARERERADALAVRAKEETARAEEAFARAAKLSEQVVALEDELKRLPAAASEVADIQAAVFKIMQDEAAHLEETLSREKTEFEEARKRHQTRVDELSARRHEILKMSGRDLSDMTRKALIERPEDPRTTCLRRDFEELKRVHEKTRLDHEAKVRQLADQLQESRAENLRLRAGMDDVARVRVETEQLREKLKRAEGDLLAEREKSQTLREREALSKHALMARVAALESPSIGTGASIATNQSREAKLVKLPKWMRLK